MARWGKVDFKELKALDKRLEQLEEADWDNACRAAANQIAAMLLNKVKKRTPVGVKPEFDEPLTVKVKGESYTAQITNSKGEKVFRKRQGKSYTLLTAAGAQYEKYWGGYTGGTLRDAWQIEPIVKNGGQYIVTVLNPTFYASYVEYGHRQKPGRYVPALGKSLKASWVNGKYMMTISVEEVATAAPKVMEKALYQCLKEAFEP